MFLNQLRYKEKKLNRIGYEKKKNRLMFKREIRYIITLYDIRAGL